MTVNYDPFDPAQVDDHDATLARLHGEEPVAEVRPGIFYLSRHEDIIGVCRDPQTFRQTRFRPLEDDLRTADQLHLGETDPPVHTEVRRILGAFFSPPAIRPLGPSIRAVCRDLVDGFAARGRADLIGEYAALIPPTVIGGMTGLPDEDLDQLRHYSNDYLLSVDDHADRDEAAAAAARVERFEDHLREVIDARIAAATRPDDLLTALVEHRDSAGLPLARDKILTHLSKDVISAGVETTTHVIGNLLYDLLSTPGAYRAVRDDRSLIPNAVEESLRHRAPVQLLFRTPIRDVEIRGVPIPAGSVVALGYASANHDEAIFDCPHEFDVHRGDQVRRHFGFGWGIHLCVGAPLARLEIVSALEAIVDRFPTMGLAPGFEYQRVRFFVIRGPVRLDVEFDPQG